VKLKEDPSMNTEQPVIEINHLVKKFGPTDAVNELTLRVRRGQCYGFFGRNGAGKTTTIKCLLNLLRPTAGRIRVFGLNPQESEVAVKSRLAYVPDSVAFYPWMSVRQVLEYLASFRTRWNRETELALLSRFGLDENKKANSLSRGQKTQLALIGAICAEPELLVLDEPTSGLDPIVRREFIETVIGAYQEADPGNRTVFVSTHLISEFEGLIEEFTILENGRAALSLEADEARGRYRKIRARFAGSVPPIEFAQARQLRRQGRELELVVNGHSEQVLQQLRSFSPESIETEALTLEEIFVATLK
jgi:ABC-2 type transport system ATP-binding protein